MAVNSSSSVSSSVSDFYDDFDDSSTAAEAVNDPEYVSFMCHKPSETKVLINSEIENAAIQASITQDEAIYLLQKCCFNLDEMMAAIRKDRVAYLAKHGLAIDVKPSAKVPTKKQRMSGTCDIVEPSSSGSSRFCRVCFMESENMHSLSCGHEFCAGCWVEYFVNALKAGFSSHISCMEPNCDLQCLRDFVSSLLHCRPESLTLYLDRVFRDCVTAHPYFSFCPTGGCDGTIFCQTSKAHKVVCSFCKASFCVKCGLDYHAPATCEILAKWHKKCMDDSETANYIRANTKDCPKCHATIEKNGGCNHMQCVRCEYHFCWMCFKDWKSHGSEYYECSRYKENPAVAQESFLQQARADLQKYLHYYERFDNHSKSLNLEEELREKLKARIETKVANHEGTWIDWQYLHDAAALLTKCRYTLQYTYPFAFFLEAGQRKELFEYQQAQLEKEIEELSWKVERAESTDRADLEKQMHVAECKRRTLLQDFLS